MDQRQLHLRRLSERALQSGSLPLELVLEVLVPVRTLRELARRFGLSPKGGFRLEKAPARVLAELLAGVEDPQQLDEVLGELLAQRRGAPRGGEDGTNGSPPTGSGNGRSGDAGDGDGGGEGGAARPVREAVDLQPILQLREQELLRARSELERAREAAARALDREASLRRELEQHREQVQRLRAENAHRTRPAAGVDGAREARGDGELQQRLRDLEHEILAREAADQALRRQLAVEHSRLRGLEEENAELAKLLPPGRRRKKPVDAPPPPERRFVLPYFAPSFYRSLDGKERKSVERAVQAILLFCTEGHSYPGLEVKQLGGQHTWSLRASLGLRVYFRHRPDGDVEFLELADREEQNTTLRRLKER